MATSSDAEIFRTTPWTAALLSQPSVTIRQADSRRRKANNEDSLIGATFNSQDTIAAALTFFDTPAPGAVQIEEVSTLLNIGTGLDGWPQIMHGGIVATVIDEAMGILLFANYDFHKAIPGRNEGPNRNMHVVNGGSFTAELKVTYKAPVVTPGIVLATARYVKRDGRKDWIDCDVIQYDEKTKKQVVCAVGNALFIARRAQL